MRITVPNIAYAVGHPIRALRYVLHRDTIPYETIARYLPSEPVIVEAGAYDGTNTGEMARFWPTATIHAFEPIPSAAELVRGKIREFGARVRCHELGLGVQDTQIEMYVSGDGSSGSCQSSSMLAPTAAQFREFPNIAFGCRQLVTMRSLDSWAASEGVPKVDFMWLDMQGYEIQALAAAPRILSTVSAIHMEVCNVQLYDDAPLYPEVKRRMASWGFVPVIEAYFRVSGNVLFVHPSRSRGHIH